MRSRTGASLEDDRAFSFPPVRRRFERERGDEQDRPGFDSAWHPLEFDASGFPLPQRPQPLSVRLRRLLGE
jgi:hypothetical protein